MLAWSNEGIYGTDGGIYGTRTAPGGSILHGESTSRVHVARVERLQGIYRYVLGIYWYILVYIGIYGYISVYIGVYGSMLHGGRTAPTERKWSLISAEICGYVLVYIGTYRYILVYIGTYCRWYILVYGYILLYIGMDGFMLPRERTNPTERKWSLISTLPRIA